MWWMKNISVCKHRLLFKLSEFMTYDHGCCYSHSQRSCHGTELFLLPLTPLLQLCPTTEIKHAALIAYMQTRVSVSRLPWFLQFLHRWGVSSGAWAAGDGAELCFCFWHCGQEANEEVVSYTDYELHQPTGGWDPLLWPAHLHQAPWPRQRAVLRPRALQCNGQQRALRFDGFWCDEYLVMLVVAKWCLYISVYVAAFLCVSADWELNHIRSFRDFKHFTVVDVTIYYYVIKELINTCIVHICVF